MRSPNENPSLQTADREQFLERLRIEAHTTATVSQAAAHLGMAGQTLRDLLDTDTEARGIWELERSRLRRDLADALVQRVKEGERTACRAAERFLRSEETEVGFDYRHVPMETMVSITGVTRQMIDRWTKTGGLPRNADGTFNLSEFIPWFGRYEAQKRAGYPLKTAVRQAVHAEVLRLGGLLLAAATPEEDE